MRTSTLMIFLIFSILISGCDLSHSASVNNQYSATVQPTVNKSSNSNSTSENSRKSENFAESNNSESNSPVQNNKNEITAASEQTVQAFYKALKERNRKEALKFAKPEVVRQLFRDKQSKLNWRFVDCEEPKVKTYGEIACFYFFEGGGIGLFLRKNSEKQYQIVSTYYMAAD